MSYELIAKFDSYLPFLVSTFVLTYLVFDAFSHVGLVLRIWDFESLVIVRAYSILIAPKHSDERSITSFFSLVLPALIINMIHYFRLNSFQMRHWSSFQKLINQVFYTLLPVIDSCFFEVIYDPFIVRRRYFNLVLDQFLNLFFIDFINPFFERPILLWNILNLIIHRVEMPYVVVWNHLLWVSMMQCWVFKPVIKVTDFHIFI
jgi:hypothetical protein